MGAAPNVGAGYEKMPITSAVQAANPRNPKMRLSSMTAIAGFTGLFIAEATIRYMSPPANATPASM